MKRNNTNDFFFYVLLTVHLSIFISVINQLDAQNFCFTISLFHASTCFEHMCSKHVEAWNKLIVKQKFCASSWLITELKTLMMSKNCDETYWVKWKDMHKGEFGVFIQIRSRKLLFRLCRMTRKLTNLFALKNELRMCLYITAASYGPILHPLEHRWINMEHQLNDTWMEKTQVLEKKHVSSICPPQIPHWLTGTELGTSR